MGVPVWGGLSNFNMQLLSTTKPYTMIDEPDCEVVRRREEEGGGVTTRVLPSSKVKFSFTTK